MGLHHKYAHGRVLRGLEAKEHLDMHKRDSHGDTIKMNIPYGIPEGFLQKDNSQQQSAVSVVFVTLPQTFSGPAMFETLTAAPTTNAQAQASHTELDDLPSPTDAAQGGSITAANIFPTQTGQTSAVAALTTLVTAASPQGSVLLGSPVQYTGTPYSGNSDSSSASASSVPTSAGISGGAVAGLIIGILLAIVLVAALFFFCLRKQKKQHQEEILDEKHASFVDAGARRVEAGANRGDENNNNNRDSMRSVRTTSTAPRLSLRPVTQFLPNLAGNRGSAANALDVAADEKPKSAWERPQQNPFQDAPVLSEKQARPESPPSDPFEEPRNAQQSAPAPVPALKPSNGNEPPKGPNMRPAGSPPMSTGAPPTGAAGAPRGPNNVHRVQLDFKPSMDDELELRSGQLVRMLHEYDDGWALCIRMDRSQQGVVPRTCLSKLPVKPRPQGPPPGSRPGHGPGPRGPMPPGNPNGPQNARALTPTQSSRSPSPQESQSDDSGAPTDPPARKPVPGQAM